MKILGISSNFHDSSAALVADGVPVAAAAEERFSYQKHDPGFPRLAIESCLRQAGLTASDVDLVAYHEDPSVKFTRMLAGRVSSFPRGVVPFVNSMRELLLGQLWIKNDIFKATGIRPGHVHYVPHHLGHATYAFAASGFEDSAVLVLDAVGEWSSSTMYRASRRDGTLHLEPLGVIPYPHSLGMVYSAFTGFFGFKVNDGECSTMALGSFGRARYVDKVRQVLRAQADGTYEVDLSFFDFSDPERLPLSPKFFEVFGQRRFFREKLPFACGMSRAEIEALPAESLYFADLAASLQAVLEETVLALSAKLARDSGLTRLCVAGGVALNSKLNGRLLREAPFEQVFIPPDPGDGGGALGASLYADSVVNPGKACARFPAYLGAEYSERQAVELVASAEIGSFERHRILPTALGSLRSISTENFAGSFDRLAERVAGEIGTGKSVGWVQGRFENGPRALGNRSILVDPRSKVAAGKLSERVKLRARFRPYACSVLEEQGERFFGASEAQRSTGMRTMSTTAPVREEVIPLISQTVHVDGTTRPQLVSKQDNPRYHRLLELWAEASGTPALLNTSFNESGLPLVSSPVDALLMFLRTDLETLVLGDTLLRKQF